MDFVLLLSSVYQWDTPNVLVPLERANLSHYQNNNINPVIEMFGYGTQK
jgi:hypothetical protein